ncbi:MAG: UDP-2,3-diacylglucosamine diphosphatase, partial [Shinella sp.]
HIHHAVITEIDGIRYINSGDWVESCTAIAEHHDGEMELITWQKLATTPAEVIPVSRQMLAMEAREPEAA